MNEKAIFEIAEIIHAVRNWNLKKLTAKEITETFEYRAFKSFYPELCKLAEESK